MFVISFSFMCFSDSVVETVKKSKKHKHKKSSKKEEVERIINVEDVEDMDISVDDVEDSPSQTLRLKIKIADSSPDKMYCNIYL